MQAIKQFSTWFSKQKLIAKLAIGVSSGILLCCLCSIPIAILSPSTSTPEARNTSVANVQETQIPTQVEESKETATPAPTDTPAPTSTPTLPPAGEARDNPVPAGMPVDIGGNMTLTIVGATRPADNIVSSGNMFNTKPEANQEYVQVDIQIVCNKSSNDTCYFAASAIKAVGADGNVHDAETFLSGIDGMIESGEFFGGATRTGKMFFIVPKDDKSVVLFYDPLLFGDTIYFALP